ncbi:hypothetical protein KKE26_11035 [bacterium]|nr:hypothetical protein [bacterium]
MKVTSCRDRPICLCPDVGADLCVCPCVGADLCVCPDKPEYRTIKP